MCPPDLFSVNTALYYMGRVMLAFYGLLPLPWIARIGQGFGWLAYHLDRRHRRIADQNVALIFGSSLTSVERAALVKGNFLRIGENFACALKTAGLTLQQVAGVFEVTGKEHLPQAQPGNGMPSVVVGIGHFGNFELYAKLAGQLPQFRGATTFRGIRPEGLDRLLREVRERSGCLFFERRREGGLLRQALRQSGLLLGLLVDQHAGDRGLRLPFLGVEASVSTAPAVYALRYNCLLMTAICRRTKLAQWRIELGPQIPTRNPDGSSRTVADLTAEINRAIEAAVLRDPVNWFWVHRRWKPKGRKSAPSADSENSEDSEDTSVASA